MIFHILLVEKINSILQKVGLTSAEAVRLFYTQICIYGGLPFEVKATPNKETVKAIEDSNNRKTLRANNIDELFDDLD